MERKFERRRRPEVLGLRMSQWGGVNRRVDVQRVNWRGIVYLQQACGMFDPKPRLVRRAS